MSARRAAVPPTGGTTAPAPPMRVRFVVRDPRVRESETLAEIVQGPGAAVPTVDCSVVLGGLVWRVAHVRHFPEAGRVEVWLVSFGSHGRG